MDYFIQMRNGQPFEHPIMGDNFRQAFPHIDVNNLPLEFARVELSDCPWAASTFEKDVYRYEVVNRTVHQVWYVVPMTEEERVEKTTELTLKAYEARDYFKSVAVENLATATEEDAVVWQQYIDALDAWTPNRLIKPSYPFMPKYNEAGVLLTINAKGSAPNVID